MKRRTALAGVVLLCTGVLAAGPNLGSAQSAPFWSTFKGSPTRAGVTTVSGPSGPAATNAWQLPKPVESSVVVGPDGIGYVGDDDGNVYAFDPGTFGTAKWKFKIGTPVVATGSLSSDGKTLYIGSQDGNLYAIKTADGTQIWKTASPLAGGIHASPVVSADGQTVFINTVTGNLYALAASDGHVVAGPINAQVTPGSMALSPDGSTLYVANHDGRLYAIPATGGNALKSVSSGWYLKGGPATSTPAIDPNGTIYVTTANGTLEAYEPGKLDAPLWTFVIPSLAAADTTPTIANGVVYFGASDGILYAVSAQNGQPVWNAPFHTSGSIDSSPAVGANKLVYFGSGDRQLYAVGAATGTEAWRKDLGDAVTSSPALGPDSSLWIGSRTGMVYRLKDLATPPGAPPPGTPPTHTPAPTAGPTLAPGPGSTPAPTAVGSVNINLKASVKAGARQTIRVTTTANTIVRFRIDYPNGDHQSHGTTSNAAGVATYTYVQGGSKITHNRFQATVTVTVGSGVTQKVQTVLYHIGFGKVDVSVEPRSQKSGKVINVYVHAAVHAHVSARLVFPNHTSRAMFRHTGPHGFAHFRYTVQGSRAKGKNRKVFVQGGMVKGSRTTYSTKTFFTILK